MSTEHAAQRRKPTRPRGDGSVFYIAARDRWAYRYQPVSGKRAGGYARTEEEAREKLRALLVDRDRGLPVISRKHSLGAWLGIWLAGIDGDALRSTSRERYAWAVKRWRADRIATVRLHRLEPAHVAEALERMRTDARSPLAPVSRSLTLTVLRLALDSALVSGHVGRNVARAPYIRGPRIERRSAGAPPEPADLARMRAAIAPDPLEALWESMLDVGLRIGEALALRWRDVDTRNGIVHVRHTLLRGGRLGEPKSRHSKRSLPVDDAVTDALIRRRERTIHGPDTFVFAAHPGGVPITHHVAESAWYALCERAHAKRCRPHDLRHSFGTRWIESGGSIAMLSRYMGHSSISITADIYGHPELTAPGLAPGLAPLTPQPPLTPQLDTSRVTRRAHA